MGAAKQRRGHGEKGKDQLSSTRLLKRKLPSTSIDTNFRHQPLQQHKRDEKALLTSVHSLRFHPVRIRSSSSSLSPLNISISTRPTHQALLPIVAPVQLHLTSVHRRVVSRSSTAPNRSSSSHVRAETRVRSTGVDLSDARGPPSSRLVLLGSSSTRRRQRFGS